MAGGIVLFSAGLDSSVAARLLIVQQVNIQLVTFLNPFVPNVDAFRRSVEFQAEQIGADVRFLDMGEDYLDIVRRPTQGYGKNLNPCIDCRIYQLKEGKKILLEEKFDFIATGEVLGQRPMSQRRQAIDLIDKRAGVRGLVVRPLCAKLMSPSRAEEQGVIDRDMLMDIEGRSRRRQMDLAKELGIESYPTPAGGCLLTDRNFSARMRDLMRHEGLSAEGIELLKVGRHFRISEGCRAVLGRNQEENGRLRRLVVSGDVHIVPEDFKGPECLMRGEDTEDASEIACALAVRLSKADWGTCRVSGGQHGEVMIKSNGLSEDGCQAMRIGADEK